MYICVLYSSYKICTSVLCSCTHFVIESILCLIIVMHIDKYVSHLISISM